MPLPKIRYGSIPISISIGDQGSNYRAGLGDPKDLLCHECRSEFHLSLSVGEFLAERPQ